MHHSCSLAENVVAVPAERMNTVPTAPAIVVRTPWAEVFVLLLALWLGGAHAETLEGKVIKVADGDTITILSGGVAHRVRLSGIDAPEKGQAFGKVARKSLAELVAGREVVVESHKVDRFGRKVGVVTVDGHDVGLRQLESGMAWHYKKYEREQTSADRERYAAAEEGARGKALGLWRDRSAVPPWEWRRNAAPNTLKK